MLRIFNADGTPIALPLPLALALGGLGADFSGVATGGLLFGTGPGALGLLPVGADRQVVVADAASVGGQKWVTAYEPVAPFATVWTANTTNPALGNGTMTMTFVRLWGVIVFFSLRITMGSTTTFGAGNWNHSLPISFTTCVFGTGAATDLSAGISYPCTVVGGAAADKCQGVAIAANVRCSASAPFAWAVGDSLALDGVMV